MSSKRPLRPVLGLIIPCHNEEEVLAYLLDELRKFSARCGCDTKILFIDDGSTDRTFEILENAARENPSIACLRFSRNFGHQTAVYAGLINLDCDVAGILDADLQDPLDDLLRMLEKWREGYDVVYGIRKNRKEGLFLRTCFSLFYRVMKRLSRVDMPLDAGDFSVMDRRVLDVLRQLKEQEPFLRGLRSWVGFRQIGVPYDRGGRAAGASSYNLSRRVQLAIHALVSFSSVPLRLVTWLGLACSGMGFILLVWAFVSALLLDRIAPGWASLAVMILFFGGIQLIMLGIVGEYIGRVFEETKGRPLFVADTCAGWLKKAETRRGD